MKQKDTFTQKEPALQVKDELVTRQYLNGSLYQFGDQVDKRFTQMDKKIDLVESRLDKKIDAVEARLDKKIETVRMSLIEYIDYRLEPFEVMRKDFYSFKDQVLTTLDWLVGAFKKFNDEHTVLTTNYSEVQKRLDDHEERLYVMETGEKYKARPKK